MDVFRIFSILEKFTDALNRLLDYLERNDRTQAEIDAITQRVKNFNAALKRALTQEEK